jgi:hypothetical protein
LSYRFLQLLLGEMPSQVFLEKAVGNGWLHLEAGPSGDRFSDLVTLRDLELLLFDGNREDKIFNVVGGQMLPEEDDAPKHYCSAEESLDGWAEGKTLIISGIDRQLPSVNALARGLEGELKCRIWCNLYLTPARGHGFETHYDPHDVFVLQLNGSKRWSLGRSVVNSPLPFQVHEKVELNDGERQAQITMRAGDVLYIPRGTMHSAVADDELSNHLTIGVHPKTYLDAILTAVTLAADRDPRFRRNLPLGTFAIGEDIITEARHWMAIVPNESFRDAGDAFCELLSSQRRRSPIDILALHDKSGRLGEEDRFRAVPYLMASLTHVGQFIELHAMGRSMSFPLSTCEDLELCCSGKVFRLADLRAQPSAETGVQLVRRLLFEGVLQRFTPADTAEDTQVDLIRHSQ